MQAKQTTILDRLKKNYLLDKIILNAVEQNSTKDSHYKVTHYLQSKVRQFEHPSAVHQTVWRLEIAVPADRAVTVEEDETADGVADQGGDEHWVEANVAVAEDVP